MGKKKSTSASGSSKVSRDWGASTITSREVNKLRTLGFISSSDDDIRLPGLAPQMVLPARHSSAWAAFQPSPFKDVLVAQQKKSWRNVLSPEESALADELFEQVVDLKNTGGLTMCGTEVVSVFLKRRVQPLMSRPHQLWMYTGEGDKSKVSSVDFSDDELHDEVRRLTHYNMRDTIALTSARSPYDLSHLPAEASTVVRCYPPTPESGVEPEDDDDSEETEDAHHALEDSDVQEEEALEDDALTRSRRRRRINDELITTAESSPSGRDDDADEAASPPPAPKSSANLFAVEDDLDLSDDDDEVPLAKRAKFSSGRPESGKESNPSHAKRTPPSRTTVEKIPVSKVIPSGGVSIPPAARDHAVKTSADQVLEANRLATDAQNENTLLKDELKKLKQKMKDEQDARRKAAAAADEKEGVLRESIANLMSAADININRARKLREDSMSDALSLAAESNVQVLGLLQKTKGALSRLYSMIFPKMKQVKTLSEMAESFLIDPSEPVEVLKRRSHLFGAVLTFQLLMGHGLGSELERFSEALPIDDDGRLINLEPFKQSAVTDDPQV
ncbi:hypothetical protein QYE76_031949 [Lolium multiflorum]|uniref:Uncharacterized protein n=1 Tax=Lolium multiflorum TaxID=4521 RepID=A0AAD8QU44_LOLMU|nr:hypothetical protein QYE76_031949 [Lolium multiflorum]